MSLLLPCGSVGRVGVHKVKLAMLEVLLSHVYTVLPLLDLPLSSGQIKLLITTLCLEAICQSTELSLPLACGGQYK